MKPAIIESPFAGHTPEETEENRKYALRAMRHALEHGYAPVASHLLYTQVLDDTVGSERALGMKAGFAVNQALGKEAVCLVYTDRGISKGMVEGIEEASANGQRVLFIGLGDE